MTTNTTPQLSNSITCECDGSPLELDIHGQWAHRTNGCITPDPDLATMYGRVADAVADDEHQAAAVYALALAIAEGYGVDEQEAQARTHLDVATETHRYDEATAA